MGLDPDLQTCTDLRIGSAQSAHVRHQLTKRTWMDPWPVAAQGPHAYPNRTNAGALPTVSIAFQPFEDSLRSTLAQSTIAASLQQGSAPLDQHAAPLKGEQWATHLALLGQQQQLPHGLVRVAPGKPQQNVGQNLLKDLQGGGFALGPD